MYTLDVKKKIDEKRNELTDVENKNRQLEYKHECQTPGRGTQRV